MKKALIAIGVLLLLLVLLVVLLPFVIDLNAYQARYLPIIENALNRKVTLKNIRLTILPRIGLRLTEFTVLDDPAFSDGPFASLSSLDVGVRLMPLLRKRVEMEEITLRGPSVTVIKNARGVLNTSTLGKTAAAQPKDQPQSVRPLDILALLAVERLAVSNGTLAYIDRSTAEPAEYSIENLELHLEGVVLGQSPVFHMTSVLQPLNLPLKLDGKVGPLQENLDLKTIHLDVAVGKTLFAINGSAVGEVMKLTVASPVIRTDDLPTALPLKKPLEIKNLLIAAEMKPPQAQVQNLSFNLFGGTVKAQGTLTTGSPSPPFKANIALQGIQLAPVMESVGTGKVSISGTADAKLDLSGRGFSMPELTKDMEGSGLFTIRDGKIEGVDPLKEVLVLLKAAGVKHEITNSTVFSVIETKLAIRHGIINVERFLLDSPNFQATATGTVGFDQTLHLKADLSLSVPISKKIGGASPIAKLIKSNGRLTVPMIIRGTVQSPSYALNTRAIGTKTIKQIEERINKELERILKLK